MNVYNIVDITPSFPYPSNTPILTKNKIQLENFRSTFIYLQSQRKDCVASLTFWAYYVFEVLGGEYFHLI